MTIAWLPDRPDRTARRCVAAVPVRLGFPPRAPRFEKPRSHPVSDAAPAFRERFVSRGRTAEVHASTAYAHDANGLTAFWYGGTREGASDVAIYRSRLDADGWQGEQVIVDRDDAAASLNRHIRKLGNSIAYQHPDGRLWLFFVTVSVGGWAGSSINLIESADNGQTWSPARRLVTSPLFNLSTLVKGNAFRYADGTIGVPVYHEFIGKFGELLRLDANARILGKSRFTRGREALQPEIAVIDEQRAVVLLRQTGSQLPRVLHTTTDDGGRSWSPPRRIGMPNPDSALDVLAIGKGRLLAAFNDLEQTRGRLTLAISDNLGEDWLPIQVLEQHADAADKDAADKDATGKDLTDSRGYQFSYPWLQRSADGDFHVLYTWNRTRIKHVRFNQRWLDGRIAPPAQPAPFQPAHLQPPLASRPPAVSGMFR